MSLNIVRKQEPFQRYQADRNIKQGMDDDRQEGQNAKRQGKETEEEEGW